VLAYDTKRPGAQKNQVRRALSPCIVLKPVQAYLGYCVTQSNYTDVTPGYMAERARVEINSYSDLAGMMTSPKQYI
jgi:hypothetical protein